jgi:hypothetical protein
LRVLGWTPISFMADPQPRLEWGDLRALRFDRPFFRRTLAAWRESGPPPTRWTGFDTLEALDGQPSLDPSLIIAHPSRCGSTLLALQIGALDDCMIVSEPRILGDLLAYGIDQPAGYPAARILRQAVRALGRRRFGDETHYVLKLSSAMAPFLHVFRRAFPQVPMVWLQRRPSDILESNIRAPGGWIRRDARSGDDLARIVLRKLALAFLAARTHVADDMLVLDYRDLPHAAWTQVLAHMGVAASDQELRRMRAVSLRHSQTGEPFRPRDHGEPPGWARTAVSQSLDPHYQALDHRRVREALVT